MFLLAFLFSFHASATPLYYGPTSAEGTLKWSGTVDFTSTHSPSDLEARELITRQYFYMLGNLRWGVEGTAATPNKTMSVSVDLVTPLRADLYRVSYSAVTNIVVDKNTQTGILKFDLVRDPVKLSRMDQSCNEDASEPNWYGFNPHRAGCKLVAEEDYKLTEGDLVVHPRTLLSFPEYTKLVGADGVLHMSIMMNNEITDSSGIVSKLTVAGYTRHTWTADEITKFLGFRPDKMPQVEDFTLTTGAHPVRITVFYGDCNIDSYGAKAFHYFYKDALENSQVVVYNGHAGLSRNLDMKLIEEYEGITIMPSKSYQLYFLAGCITYGYYADGYLGRKATPEDPRGTKALDLIAFGETSPGYDDAPLFSVTDAIMTYATSGDQTSYQNITNKIDYSWLGVVGDEDNPLPQ